MEAVSLDPPQTNLAHSPPLCAPVWTHRRQDRLLIRAWHSLINLNALVYNLKITLFLFHLAGALIMEINDCWCFFADENLENLPN